jgi:hypothetical protein
MTLVIHEAAMAMHFHAKINDFIELLHVYPTMAEALKIAAISRRKIRRSSPAGANKHVVCTAEENVGVLLCPTNCRERGRRRTQRKEISPQRH